MASQVLDSQRKETSENNNMSPIKVTSPHEIREESEMSPSCTETVQLNRVDSVAPTPNSDAPQQIVLSQSEKQLEKSTKESRKSLKKDVFMQKHPYLQHTIRPLSSISRLLQSH
jgi:hypothetical protein